MQEEVTRGAVTLIVDGAKLSEQVFEKAVKKFLEEIQKSQKPKIYRGRQSLKQLASQNAGLANIEISDKNIKAFLPCGEEIPCGFCLEEGLRCRAAPLPGLFQKPGCGCHHSGISGVCQPENEP